MLTATITNTSGSDFDAGFLPAPFQFLGLDDTVADDAVLQVHDLDKIEENHSGFTSGDILQQLVQNGTITITFVDLGATDVSVVDDAVATAA